ncbi:MAG: UDP-N-acetylmuramoyl-L-alanyl-D-glutamate--2,6-diaminopimelate ligase [Treponema sp.]|nr:UDP-N-acetylmuramoyl-L-alanyl-D-glutamate--2,6-diaminopimelate ligase [Treponema sp.]
MKKNLSVIINRLKDELKKNNYGEIEIFFYKDVEISSIEFDSRKVKKGSLFFALPGLHFHGNSFIKEAINKSAHAIVFQDKLNNETFALAEKMQIPLIKVSDTRFAMSPASDEFYDKPSEKLICIGVTGTEGKSSTVSFVWQLLRLCNKKAGFISTVEYSIGEESVSNPEHQTTPESPIVQRQLFEMVKNGCEYAVIESSSHGLSKKTNRLGNVLFDCAIFMNVTQEHLEFHGTLEQYKFDKANLFRALDKHEHKKNINGKEKLIQPLGIVCADSENAKYFCDATKKNIVGFSMNNNVVENSKNYCGSLFVKNFYEDSKGIDFNVNSYENKLRINLPGTFNLYNVSAAILAVNNLINNFDKPVLSFDETIATSLPKLKTVKGRMSIIDEGQNFEVIVDYAHTPSSFQTIFPPLKNRCKGKIISLFGSGGERDTKKRPVQGQIADEFSDIIILCDEDPRGENPMNLLQDIANGIKNKKQNETLFLIPDRPKAIRKAFDIAKENDIVLLLGKSHENSIIYKDYIMDYDEITEAKKALNEKGFTK